MQTEGHSALVGEPKRKQTNAALDKQDIYMILLTALPMSSKFGRNVQQVIMFEFFKNA
jgi:hypothetical protein